MLRHLLLAGLLTGCASVPDLPTQHVRPRQWGRYIEMIIAQRHPDLIPSSTVEVFPHPAGAYTSTNGYLANFTFSPELIEGLQTYEELVTVIEHEVNHHLLLHGYIEKGLNRHPSEAEVDLATVERYLPAACAMLDMLERDQHYEAHPGLLKERLAAIRPRCIR